MEDCSPCPFGFTSRAGARSADDCVPESQPCPIGQIAPPNAESADQCFCLPGYGGEQLCLYCWEACRLAHGDMLPGDPLHIQDCSQTIRELQKKLDIGFGVVSP
jgi:hypothetical protein